MSAGAIYFGSAAVVALLGLALLVWALFADRSRGRKRCPKCWYDMSAAVNLRCPECGREVKHEKRLLRTRRRWKIAFATLLPFLIAGILAVQPKVQRDGWWSIMPTTIMLLYFQFEQDDAVVDAINRRMSVEHEHPALRTPMFVPEEDRLYEWQWRWLATRTAQALAEDQLSLQARHTCMGWAGFCRDVLDGESLRTELQEALVMQLDHEQPGIRSVAAFTAVDVRDPEGGVALMLPLVDDEDERVMGGAMAGLRLLVHRTNSDIAVHTLIELLQHPNMVVQDYAASSLGMAIPHQGRRDEVEQALRDAHRRAMEEGGVRERILIALTRLTGPEEWLPDVRRSIESDDPDVRAEAIFFLSYGNVSCDEFANAFLRELRDDDATAEGRRAAAWALQHIGIATLRRHETDLIELSRHDDSDTAEAALKALIRIDPTNLSGSKDDP